MNIRSLTRGDGAVIGAALLLLIASFFPFFDIDGKCPIDSCSVSVWSRATLPVLPTVHLLGLIAAGLFLSARLLPEGRKLLGLALDQWGMVLCLVVGWAGLWSMLSLIAPDLDEPGVDPNAHWQFGAGAYLTVVFAVALAALGVLSTLLPALKAPLLGAPRQPNPYGGHPQAGYGYPGGPQQGQPGPYGGQPQGGYGYPGGPQQGQPGQPGQQGPYGGQPQGGHPQQAQPQPGQPQPGQPQQAQQAGGPAAGGGAPDPNFQPFWFAVPVTRPLFGEDGSPQPVAELAPGTWYLAVEQRGQALVAQTQDGRRGVLQDTQGIQRG